MGEINETAERRSFTAEESARAKSLAQAEANAALEAGNGSGLVVMATGSGKSKVGIDRVDKELHKYWPSNNTEKFNGILLIVPTEKLRDVTWKDEFEKWKMTNAWQFITPVCYKSIHNMKDTHWDLIILDECHNVTELNSEFFFNNNNTWTNIIGLTATEPRKLDRLDILKRIGLKLVYELPLDVAVKRGIVAPYDITMIGVPLNGKDKNVKSGRKEKPFYQTEVKKYEYLMQLYLAAPSRANALTRMRFIYGLKSKTEAAKKILEHLIPEEMRTIIFCSTKEQANELCKYRFYSAPTKPKMKTKSTSETMLNKDIIAAIEYGHKMVEYQGDVSFELFNQKLINKMSCCQSLNEGQNLTDVDCGLGVQMNSSDLNMIQRLGRFIRTREGHRGKMIILYALDTMDEMWVREATAKLDQSNIRWIEYEKLRKGEEQINF